MYKHKYINDYRRGGVKKQRRVHSQSWKVLFELGFIHEHATCFNSGCAASLAQGASGSDTGMSGLKLDDDVLGVKDFLQASQNLLV